MAAYEVRENSGSLFRNDRATTDKHPTHKGQARIDGVDYWVSAWTKTSNDGTKRFFSLAFERKDQAQAQKDIPFGADSPPASRGGKDAPQSGQGPSSPSQAASGASHGGDDLDDIPFQAHLKRAEYLA
jgi:hypothetical protein